MRTSDETECRDRLRCAESGFAVGGCADGRARLRRYVIAISAAANCVSAAAIRHPRSRQQPQAF